jgi:peptidyl-prolyl cis-trans isomerase SurA
MMKYSLIAIAAVFVTFTASAQNIFTYGGRSVSSAEFMRMYTKNTFNNKKPDLSEKALREYVALYSRFKMKVTEAEEKGIDTLGNIKSELNTYRRQLAKSYLTDKDVVAKLSAEAYERMKKDIKASHILIAIPKASDRDSARFLAKADSLYKVLLSNKTISWDSLVKYFTDDKSTIPSGGSVGYFTALQVPYAFESAVYKLPVGGISKPVRTTYGYHIIKKTAERPARGQVKVAHILCAAKKSEGETGRQAAKLRADSILAQLKSGYSFDSLAKNRNDDRYSVNSNGELTAFGVGAMVPEFEDAAFALTTVGEYSAPVATEYGYHIIKLLEKMPIKPYAEMGSDVSKKVERDGRVDVAKRAFLEKMKAKNKFKENAPGLSEFIASVPDSLSRNGTVQVGTAPASATTLFTVGPKNYTINDFRTYLETSARGRLYGTKNEAISLAYSNYADASVMDYEESNLETTNSEYRNLLKEYRDGIILFDLTDKSVWSKATVDTTGLAAYYSSHKSKYQWGPCFEGDAVKCTDLATAQSFLKAIQNGAAIEAALKQVNEVANSSAGVEPVKLEYEKLDPSVKKLAIDQFSQPIKNSDNSYTIYRPKVIYAAASQKTLAEARGYAIADYQDFLEKDWLASLETKYPVVVNEAALKALVKPAAVPKAKK